MSSNSEFPVSNQSPEEEGPQILHTGSSQLPPSMRENIPDGAQPIEEGISAPDTVWEGMEKLTPTPKERHGIDQATAAQRDSFNTQTAPKEKSGWEKLRKRLLGGAAVGTTALIGTMIYANIAAGEKDPGEKGQIRYPLPETTNSAPATSGSVETDTPSSSRNGGREGLGTDTHKFLAEDGKTFLTHEQLVTSASVPVAEYPDSISAQKRFYELMEKRANYEPTEEEVRNNLNIPADQELTVDDYRAAAALYRKAYNGLFEKESGGLFEFMEEFGADVFDIQISNYGASATGTPKVNYKANLEFAGTRPEFTVSDNVAETELVTNAPGVKPEDVTGFMTGTYELTFTGFGPDQVTEGTEKVWKFGDRVVVNKAK